MSNNQQNNSCFHLSLINGTIKRNTKGCEECEKTGSKWIHLRLYLSCGYVGCCDSSVNKHGTKHFQETNHPIIKLYEPGENWKWCYQYKIFMK